MNECEGYCWNLLYNLGWEIRYICENVYCFSDDRDLENKEDNYV